jgi:hypothetical protein
MKPHCSTTEEAGSLGCIQRVKGSLDLGVILYEELLKAEVRAWGRESVSDVGS